MRARASGIGKRPEEKTKNMAGFELLLRWEPRRLCGVLGPMADQRTLDLWLTRAEEVRARAAEMRDPNARRTMLQIAIMYHLMALQGSRGRETVRRPTRFVAWLGRLRGGQRPGS